MKHSETNKIFVDAPEEVLTINPEVEEIKFSHVQLNDALLYAQDVLERSMIPFMVFGDTAEQMERSFGCQYSSI